MAHDPNDPNAAPQAPASPSPGAGWKNVNGAWLPPDHPLAQGSAGGSAPTPPDLTQAAPQPSGGVSTAVQPQTTPALFQQGLNSLLSRSTTPQATDPEIAAPLAANRLSESQNVDLQRAMLAEQASQEGTLGSGGFDTRKLGILEDSAQRSGQYEGDLYKNATTQRIQELQSALSLAGSTMDANQKNALQKELLDLENRRTDQQQGQFDTSNSLQLGEFNAQQNQQALLALLNGGQ